MPTFKQIEKVNLLSDIQRKAEEIEYLPLFEAAKELVDMSRCMNTSSKHGIEKNPKNPNTKNRLDKVYSQQK